MAEELGVHVVAVQEVSLSVADPGSDFLIEFLDVEATGEPQAIEHSELAWVGESRLLDYDLAPSDRRFVEWLLGLNADTSSERSLRVGDGTPPPE